MFGFKGFHQPKQSKPSFPPQVPLITETTNSTPLPNNIELVAKEDIFSRSDEHSVLLVKAGTSVDAEMLEKLIRYGVQPHQFYLKRHRSSINTDTSIKTEETVTHYSGLGENSPNTNPMTSPMTDTLHRPGIISEAGMTDLTQAIPKEPNTQGVHRNNIVIIDPNEVSLKRLVQQLGSAGTTYSDLHPVNRMETVTWALEKYQPSILMVDEKAFPLTGVVAKLNSMQAKYHFEQMVLLITPATQLDKNYAWLADRCEGSGITLIQKPLGHFQLTALLEAYKAKKQIQKQIQLAEISL